MAISWERPWTHLKNRRRVRKSYYGYYYCETSEKVNELYWAVMSFKSSEMREHEMVHNMNVWVIERLSVGVIGKKTAEAITLITWHENMSPNYIAATKWGFIKTLAIIVHCWLITILEIRTSRFVSSTDSLVEKLILLNKISQHLHCKMSYKLETATHQGNYQIQVI